MKMVPVRFVWREVDIVDAAGVIVSKKVMEPLARYSNVCGRQFHEDEEYPLIVLEARSRASHDQYFAAVHEGWQNLPESIAVRWPTDEHLRKWCLIECGWFDEKDTPWDSKEDAMRHAAFVREDVDEYARLSVHKTAEGKWRLIVRHAKSQSAAAMAKGPFEESKRAVLDMIASFVNVRPAQLEKQAGRSA